MGREKKKKCNAIKVRVQVIISQLVEKTVKITEGRKIRRKEGIER